MNCTSDNTICTDVENSLSLIQTINSKITEGTTDKTNMEAACSLSLNEIKFNDCVNAVKNQDGDWQNTKYLMHNFGIQGSIDRKNLTIKFNSSINTQSLPKCGEKILKEYTNLEASDKELRIAMLNTFSSTVALIQTNVNKSNSNIFIGDTYIKNENSTCNFNKNNILNIDYNNYNYIFCSKSSGWLPETDITRSNCALTRQEVFLLKWKSDYFINWCIENYKNYNSHCTTDGNDYVCQGIVNQECNELRDNFFCNDEYSKCSKTCAQTSKICLNDCKNKYLQCKNDKNQNICSIRCKSNKCFQYENFNECFENENYSVCGCNSVCSKAESEECKTCLTNCIDNNSLNLSKYQENLYQIESCTYDKIEASQNPIFQTCILNETETCNDNCTYEYCINECLDIECKDVECFERSSEENDYFDKKSCKDYSCYYSCQKQCTPIKIDTENSKIMTHYREVEDDEITGSSCNVEEIFTFDENNNKYNDYCIIEQNISN
jgi:hypothetical protein